MPESMRKKWFRMEKTVANKGYNQKLSTEKCLLSYFFYPKPLKGLLSQKTQLAGNEQSPL